jgi:hypothetical protein
MMGWASPGAALPPPSSCPVRFMRRGWLSTRRSGRRCCGRPYRIPLRRNSRRISSSLVCTLGGILSSSPCRAIVPENGILQQSNNRQPVRHRGTATLPDRLEVSHSARIRAGSACAQPVPNANGIVFRLKGARIVGMATLGKAGGPASDLTFKVTLSQKALAFGSRAPPWAVAGEDQTEWVRS